MLTHTRVLHNTDCVNEQSNSVLIIMGAREILVLSNDMYKCAKALWLDMEGILNKSWM